MSNKHSKLDIALGLYLLITASITGIYYVRIFSITSIDELFWYCNIAMVALSLGFLFRKPWIFGMILVSAIPTQFFWIYADILYIFQIETMERLNWLSDAGILATLGEFNYHLAIIPCAVYGVWKYGYHPRSYQASIILGVSLLILTRTFTDPGANVNCFFYPCDMAPNALQNQEYGWPYAITRCAYFILFSGLIHLTIRKFKQ